MTPHLHRVCLTLHLILTLAVAPTALAATVASFSPQGEVQKVRQVRATFSEPAINFGDPKAAAPFDIQCSEAGSGRWADARNWVYDFKRDLPAGIRCGFTLKPGLTVAAGAAVTGKRDFAFSTGGPAVMRTRPYEGSQIDEEQIFLLVQNGAVSDASLRAHVYCTTQGVQERIPVTIINGAPREQLLKKFLPNVAPELISAVQCQQRLPNGGSVDLVWERGMATLSGVATSNDQVLHFKVRDAFSATFSCQRENANAPCTPILPVTLSFSAPVSTELAQRIAMRSGSRTITPVVEPGESAPTVTTVQFKPPFTEKSEFTIELPSGFKDDAGRPLDNAGRFPIKASMGDYPPLAKFAAAPFGIIELDADANLPVTLRRVEPELVVRSIDGKAMPSTVTDLNVTEDAAILAWLDKLSRYHETSIMVGKVRTDTRSLSLLATEARARRLAMPATELAKDGSRPFEVVGIPLPTPGFHVVELSSQRLGASLLGKPVPMYVRTSALVTNLSVHVKLGRENGAVWVTTLDSARPVADADIRISSCAGKELWRGRTDRTGVARMPAIVDPCIESRDSDSDNFSSRGLFVSARKTDERGRADMAFALTSWNNGIESYRFNLPTERSGSPTVRAHTIFDRTLLRAGETVSMKHQIRAETTAGFALMAKDRLPNRVRLIHQGSNQTYTFPLTWRGGKAAETVFAIPKEAKLGSYQVLLDRAPTELPAKTTQGASDGDEGNDDQYGDGRTVFTSGSFRVEEFRLPVMQGIITPPKGVLIAPRTLPLAVQLQYLNGGGAAGAAVRVTSLLRGRSVSFPGYDEFSFAAPRDATRRNDNDDSDAESGDSGDSSPDDQKIVANQVAATLDKNGSAIVRIDPLPLVTVPKELLSEMTFADPNGEIQTVSIVSPLWPSNVVLGIRSGSWVSVRKKLALTAVALDTSGKPQAGVAVDFVGTARKTSSHRKRMVGGFYAYQNDRSESDLGSLCSGTSDAKGLVRCEIEIKEAGNVDITARARDGAGNLARASTSVWVTREAELWFDGENQDRMEILPEKKRYQPGETAVFQVRMPFRQATALVAIEREGVIETSVVQLDGRDPTIRIPVKASYGPNVYVSVLAVRARLREVPWYSFFVWGWREPLNWWQARKEYQAPAATVDLAKPAYKFGIAEIAVGTAANQLNVTVTTDQPAYPIRSRAKVTVEVTLPDGKPAAGAEIAVAAIDEALLELQRNDSWNLLDAMLQRRSYGMETSTAQMQVVGRRHYGRKALPPGGSGGKAPTRELLDTLLLWQPAIVLDAAGRAQIEVPLNDALTRFRIMAVADSGTSLFGSGGVSIRSTQDLQLIAGLPPLVREGDRFRAMVTVRNTTARSMDIDATAKAAGTAPPLPPTRVTVAAGASTEVGWDLTVPQDVRDIAWDINAQEISGAKVQDHLRVVQKVVPAVPVTVQQATLLQIEPGTSMPVAQPADSLPGRGGLLVSLARSVAGNTDGMRRYFETYPYVCLEQKTSRAIGLRDAPLWQRVATELPGYLDSDGLLNYYPSSESGARGSDTLTAYVLAATHEAGYAIPQESRDRMLNALTGFVEGRITRDFWSPKKDLDVRKLSALEALSRYGRAQPAMLGSIQIAPNLWPTSALLDWITLLRRLPTIPENAKRSAEADQILRARLNYSGTRMGFSSEASDYWWWLMASADTNATRLILLMLDQPTWRADLPKIVGGALARQQRGHWGTTTANVWGSLALEKFSKQFEAEVVTGATRATLRTTASPPNAQSYEWKPGADAGRMQLSCPAASTPTGPPMPATLTLEHIGKGKPWATLQSLAAVPLKQPFFAGYRVTRTVVPVEQKVKGAVSRGDVFRINLEVDAQTDMSWVVLTDPVPAGATVLGSGLGRDSAIASAPAPAASADSGRADVAYEERSFESFRTYYRFVPKGRFTLSYTIRLNNVGEFNLPPTRIEAMYAPEMFGELPNAVLSVR